MKTEPVAHKPEIHEAFVEYDRPMNYPTLIMNLGLLNEDFHMRCKVKYWAIALDMTDYIQRIWKNINGTVNNLEEEGIIRRLPEDEQIAGLETWEIVRVTDGGYREG